MGTDIHLEVEVFRGAWEYVPHIERVCWACVTRPAALARSTGRPVAVPGAPTPDCPVCSGAGRRLESYYHSRHYDVFAILADVRNGYGFAGCDTGDGFKVIAKPRGLPKDMSFELRRLSGLTTARAIESGRPNPNAPLDEDGCYQVWLGDHSFSWLLLSEVLAFDWNQTTKHRGWVDAASYRDWAPHRGRPANWCGGISGPNVEHVTNAEMERRITNGSAFRRGAEFYTAIEWVEPYRESAADFLEVVERDLVPLGEPKDTRLVFGFDS